jgi:hypothetical protein
MTRYALLVLTWVIILSVNLYLLVRADTTPIVWLWVILAGLAIIPIAQRLKIGNWLDFSKKAKDKQSEPPHKSEERIRISNFNIVIPSEEAAQAFVKSKKLKYLVDYEEDERIGIIPEESEGTEKPTIPVIKAVKAKEIDRLYFLSAANEAIAGVLPLLQTIYSTIIAKRYDRLMEHKDLSKDILSMIEDIVQYAPEIYTFEDSDSKFRHHMAPVKQLIELRNDVEEKKADPPPIELGRKLLSEVRMTTGFLLGMVSTGLSMLVRGYILNSINIKDWSKKPTKTKDKEKQNREINK